ncbi:LysR family transcriptional regulator [Methylophilus sp. Leaf414]|uniref:LysR family transcriptional regulator n=1 Tax=Methylophilus sp. Leaf414 TaxID=1736371 RepID=UPI0006F6B4FD|nr:LysR family transcriptional regulator [Methylophilus sp. Leaf414]KQT38125.1 transcriptional regulator [Methylophilus sp. Leaf414]
MDTNESLKRFVRVAELGSFTKAAESLSLPKASVSQAIQQLETKLQTQLFHRTTRTVQLTPDGQLFYEKSKDVLSEIEELETLFISDDSQISGVIRVNMSHPMARHLVIPALPEFLQRYPNLSLDISSEDRKVDLISEGYDCVVRTGEVEESGMIMRKIGEMQQTNFASPAYIAEHGEPRSIEDLQNHYLIHYQTGTDKRFDAFEYSVKGQAQSYKMKSRICVNNTDAYRAACAAGLGIMQAPRFGAHELLASGNLVEILRNSTAPAMPVSLLFPHRRNLSKRVRIFMDWLSEVIKTQL